MPAEISVVIPSLNGADGVDRCLRALATQPNRSRMEIIVVDDGSSDNTAAVARAHGVAVISHPRNLGVAAARKSGVNAATADIVVFLDDDCEPEPGWAEHLLAGYSDDVAGVGGTVVPRTASGFLAGYLTRNNPHSPLSSTSRIATAFLTASSYTCGANGRDGTGPDAETCTHSQGPTCRSAAK